MYHVKNDLRHVYINRYSENIRDDFNKILDPPANPFFLEEQRKKEEEEIQRKEDENDDIKFHYKCIESKYKYFADLVYKMSHPQEFEDDINVFEYKADDNMDSDNLSNMQEESEDDYYDDEIYDEYNDEYYSDEEY
jgi:hypothetical protein